MTIEANLANPEVPLNIEEHILLHEENLGVADLNLNILDDVTIEKNILSLNVQQRIIFDKVINTIVHSESHKNKSCL